MYPKSKIFDMSKELCESGIYFLYSKKKKLVYIGKSYNLRRRLGDHYYSFEFFKNYIRRGIRNFNSESKPFEYFRYCFVPFVELDFYENYFIKCCNPVYNGTGIFVEENTHMSTKSAKKLAKYA